VAAREQAPPFLILPDAAFVAAAASLAPVTPPPGMGPATMMACARRRNANPRRIYPLCPF